MPGKKYFMLKLVPPRTTFAMDMTDVEKKLMGEHAAYWKELMAKGVVIVFGPVLDPKGVFGLGIVEVEREEQVTELFSQDPTVKAGLNKLEYYPIYATVRGE